MMSVSRIKKPKLYQGTVTVFTATTQKLTIYLHDGEVMMMLIRDQKPIIHAMDGQGEYEVDCPEASDHMLPIGVMPIDRGHIKAWENVEVEVVNRMIDRISIGVANRRAGLPINNGEHQPAKAPTP